MPKHQAFVDYFTHEFMEELWYLQKVARGDIPKRAEVDPWENFFNVTQGLLSLAPIPGLPLGFLLSKELVKQCIKYGEKGLKLAQQANSIAQAGYKKWKEKLEQVDSAQQKYEAIAGKPESKGMLQQGGPLDLTAIRVLVELVGRGLAERYEHVLNDYLTDPAEKSQLPLARIMARRLFHYLQSQPLLDEALSGDLLAQRTRLLNGVLLGKIDKDKSWREKLSTEVGSVMPRVLKDMHKVELPLQDAPKKQLGRFEKFTAEGVIKRSAWYDDKQVYGHAKTDWQTPQGKPQQPKYGYAYLVDPRLKPIEMKAVSGSSVPPFTTRYYRPVTLKDIQEYLSSAKVQAARASKKPCTYNFHDFLHHHGHPRELQAVCHDNLTGISDWSFANFKGVDFSGTILTGNISSTNFSDAYLVGVTAKSIYCHKDYPVNLSHAQLGFGDWRGAKLPKADFTQTDCSLLNLSDADLTDILGIGTNWYKTDLTGITRQDLLAEQAKQVNEMQNKFSARMRELDGQVTQLEQTLAPMLLRLDALEAQPQSAVVGRKEERESQISELQAQINNLANSQFKQFCEAELRELRERTDVLRTDVDQLKTQLQQLEIRFGDQINIALTAAGDVGRKILVEQTMVQLTHRVKDLEFYLPPTVIKALPEKMSLDDLMIHLNTTSNSTTTSRESKHEAKGEAVGAMPIATSLSEPKHKDVEEVIEEEALTGPPLPLPQRLDAITIIDQFLTQDENFLLLLGEPGAGKTLSTWQVTRRLIHQFKPGMSGQQISQCWLPIHVELNQFGLSDLAGLIDQELKRYGLNEAAIKKLKQAASSQTEEPRVLLILDGYDELRQETASSREYTDLFRHIGGATWKAGQLKILVTCRRGYFADEGEERLVFGVGEYQRYQRYELLPFTLAQIQQYVTARSTGDVGGGLFRAERYLNAIAVSDSLKKLVSNPFVLQLFLESLPRLEQNRQDIHHLVRYDLYSAFLDQWIEREVRRLSPAKKALLGRDNDVALVRDFKRLARYLALAMYAKGVITVEFSKPKQETLGYQAWFSVLKQVAIEAEQEYLVIAAQSSEAEDDLFGLTARKPKPDKSTFMRQAQARANQLADLLPLTGSKASKQFVHRSFYEYLVAASIIELSDYRNKEPLVAGAILGFFKQRLIQTEPAIIGIISELPSHTQTQPSHASYAPLYNTLTNLVMRSAQEKSLGQASSNAATILNYCNADLVGMDWAGAQLVGADLNYSVLANSNLAGANLENAELMCAMLHGVNFMRSNLHNVHWGEKPYIKLLEQIDAIAHHPKKPWVAVSQAWQLLLINYETGEKLYTLGCANRINSISFSPDGNLLAVGCYSPEISLWDIRNQQKVGVLSGHTGPVMSIDFSKDGELLVSGSKDATVRIWKVLTQKAYGKPLIGHAEREVRSVAFSPDKRLIASKDRDGLCLLWNVQSQQPFGTAMDTQSSPYETPYEKNTIAFSPDSRLITTGHQLWEVRTQKLFGNLGRSTSIAFSPDGRLLASGDGSGMCMLWLVQNLQPFGKPWKGHTREITGIKFSADGKTVVSASFDGHCRVWDMQNQKLYGKPLVPTLPKPATADVQIIPGGGKIDLSNVSNEGVCLPSGAGINCISCAKLSPNKSWVVLARNCGSYAIFSVKTPPTANLYTEHTERNAPGTYLEFSPDGRKIAAGDGEGNCFIFSLGHPIGQGLPLLGTLKGHADTITSLSWNREGCILASASHDKTIRIWDTRSFSQLDVIKWHTPIKRIISISEGHERSVETLEIEDEQGMVGTWIIKDGSKLKFIKMFAHPSMPLHLEDAQFAHARMQPIVRRMLEQQGANVSEVIEDSDNMFSTVSSKFEDKSAVPTKLDDKSVLFASPFSQRSSFFASSSPQTNLIDKPADAKAQGLLKEMYQMIDESYPIDNHQANVAKSRVAMLAQLKPYQDRYEKLNEADRAALRKLQLKFAETQQVVDSVGCCIT